jgi:gliding motility-associated-like protein
MKKILLIFLSILYISSIAQNYQMNNTSVNTCSGNFFDSGGNGGNYSASETYTKTFCPGTAGTKLRFIFSTFNTENTFDVLTVYDGNSTGAPVIGSFMGTTSPGTVQATVGNASGCLTFVWRCDGSVQNPGWAAAISCYTPCETINSNFVSSTPAPVGGIIKVCQGQSITFNGSGTFSSGSGTGATYTWDFGNSTTGNGTTASTSYATAGVYAVNLNINKAGCTNANKFNQIVQVSTTPSFSATTTSTNSICLGQSATLIGSVSPTPFVKNCTPPVSGTTFLPDGSGVSYSTSIVVDCYNSGQTITSASDIQSICLNMEHSYQGDVSIQIICPNGQVCNLKDYPGGPYNYLGAPLDDPAVGPGVGANYCFAMSGTVLLCNGPTIAGQGTPPNTSIAAGTYSPTGNFSSLIGCPMNGSWTIRVTDNLNIDNGYIFNWDVNFTASAPASSSFTPNIVSQTWSGANITSTSGNNAVITPTSTGTHCYTLTATDNFGCSYNTVRCVTVTPGPYAGVSNTLAVCNSAASTNLFGLLGSGVSTTGTWSGPAPALTGGNLGTFNPSSYAPGTYNYTYTVPGTGSCPPATAVVSVTVRPRPAATLSFTNPTCGNNNGIVVINNTSSGGQTITSFTSNIGAVSGQTVTGLGAGSPIITLTNNFGCTFTVSTTLTNQPGPTNITTTFTNATCGNNNGSISFGTPTGGTGPYTYSVNGVSSTSPKGSLGVGTYTVLVRDANGCTFTKTVSITNIPGPTAVSGTTTQASCNTNNGTYNVTGVTGGTAAYTYSVDGVSTASLTTGLSAGTHTILVRDANGCTFNTTFAIGTANGPSTFNVNSTNASCGTANGTSTISGVVGGTPTYSFSFDGGAFGTGTTTTGLAAGPHSVTVRDANSCTLTVTYNVANNAPPTASISSSLNILCNGANTGSLTVTPSGGTSPYTYTISTPTQTNTTGAFTGLSAGAYNITVKDASGCTATLTANLTQPTALTGTTSSLPVNCFGNSTGTVSAGASGGTSPYTYLWPAIASSTNATTGGVAAGTYSVIMTDANNCSITRTVTVTQPTSLTLTSTVTAATCGNSNGTGTVTVTGGTSPYVYNWSNGGTTANLSGAAAGTQTITITDNNGCVLTRTVSITNIPGPTGITEATSLAGCNLNNGTYTVTGVTGGTAAYTYSVDGVSTTSVTTGLGAGTHNILVRDANGCTYTNTFSINTANGPTSATVATTNANCGSANGTATVTGVTGGAPVYNYSFNGGAFGASATTSGLAAGTHTVVIRDANSCTLTVTYTELNNSGPTASVTSSSNILCNGASTGSVSVSPTGGSAPFTYTLSSPTQTNTTGNFTGLPAGSYNITLSDNFGCSATATVTLTQPSAMTLTVTSVAATCFGASTGTVSASGSGGTGAYTYLWPSLGGNTNPTVTTAPAGTYSVTQTDANGCTITQSVTVTQPTALSLTSTVTAATCGYSNGSASVTASGATPAYTYSWSTGSSGSVLSGVPTGIYSVTVTDFKGCNLTNTVSINNIAGPTAITGTASLAGCGLSNASYTVTGVTGGTPVYSYSVNGISTTTLTNGLAAGIQTITVSDANGCVLSNTFNISTTAGPTTASITSSNASCGTANGTATVVSVTGGQAAYQYSFDGGAFSLSNTTTGLTASTHTVTILDANSCTLTTTYNVLNNGSPTITVPTTTNVTCFGGTNGVFTASGTGGSGGPFTYTLTSPFQTSALGSFTGLSAGTYTVIGADGVGCTNTTTVNIAQPTAVSLTVTSIPAKCFNTPTGTINISGSGGTGAYTYSLNGGSPQTSPSYTAVGQGSYVITIGDANNCTTTQTVSVTEPTALSAQVSTQNANCTAANGAATSTVSGGTPIYTYSWSTGATSDNLSNVPGGNNYTLTATDVNGCTVTAVAAVSITPGGSSSILNINNVTCNGYNDGSITAGPVGGAAPFSYSWSPSGQTNATATNLAPATYTCEITDFYGCKSYTTATITQPTVLDAIMNSTNVKCFNTPTGTVTAAGTGGTGPYTYLWPTLASTLATVPNVAVGIYSCQITDGNNCTITQTISVTEPTDISLTSTVTSANCNQSNGSATVTASGGVGGYSYNWSSGSTTDIQTNIAGGTYTIDVRDANNCIKTLAVTVSNVSGPSISILTQTNVSCFGVCDGAATSTVSGGVPPYIYSWSSGHTSSIATNLCAQIYTASVTDQAGCVASMSVNISQPTVLTVTVLPSDPKCFGASNGYGIAAALGGVPNYTYAWTGGGGNNATSNPIGAGNYGLTVTDANGCIATSSMTLNNPPAMAASITSTNVSCFGTCNGAAIGTTTNNIGVVDYQWIGGPSPIFSQTASNLCAGTYTLIAIDQNSCTANAIVVITEPALLTANIASTGSVTCSSGNNGFASVSAAGGTGPYSYSWTGAASSAGNSTNANNLPAGVYSVTVTDAQNCTAITSATITEPTPLSTTLTTTDPLCNGATDGTGNIVWTGGVGIPTVLWQPGLQSGNSVNTLAAGNQTVTISYNSSCSTNLTFTLAQPAALTAAVTTTNSNCGQANGFACATVGGGTGALNYLWSNGVTTLCNNNIVAGAYTFTVTDVNGCVEDASGLINDISGPVVAINSFTNVTCFGLFNGGATATITGGTPNYNIVWSGSQAAANTTTLTTNFGAGLHNITVTDAAGCVGTASVDIVQPAVFVSAISSSTNITCFGASDGGATVLVNGGTAPFNYAWTPSAQTNSVLVNITANNYSVNVTDANGCTTISSVVITEPQPLVISSSSFTNVSCFGGNTGQIKTVVQGGTPGYTYSWTPTQPGNTGSPSGLVAGAYNVTVSDANNCFVTANFNITEPAALTSTYTSLPATCGLPNGSATVTVGGGVPNYTVNWNTAPAQSGFTASNMAPGNWNANITDANGCILTQSVNVANPPVPAITNFSVTQPSCFGLSNGEIIVNYSAGTAPYTVVWSSPISQTLTSAALSQSVAGIAAGMYTATLTDSYGCTTSQPVNVNQPGLLVLVPTPNVTICYGQTTQISASGQSGTPAYSYTWAPNPFVGGGPHTVNPTTTSQYTVTVSDSKGCSPSPKIITVSVTPSLSITSGSATLCHGESTFFAPSIVSPGNGGPYTYSWSPSNATTQTITAFGNAPSVQTTVTYTVVVDDGCTIPNASSVFTLVTNPLPTVDFVASTTVVCAPSTIEFTATPGTIGSYSYEWINDGKNVIGTTNPISYNYTKADSVDVTVTITDNNTGCKSTLVKTDYIVIHDQPIASFYPDPQTISVLTPSVNFVNTSQNAVSYYWNFGDPTATPANNVSTQTNPDHYYNLAGTYYVYLIATSQYGCKDTAYSHVDITPDFALYIPNSFTPDGNGVNDMFQPVGIGINEDDYKMEIFDRWGESIFTSNDFRKGWDGTVKGGSKIAPQGVYIYKVNVKDVLGGVHPYVGHVTLIKKENN